MSRVRPVITSYGCVHVVCVAYTRSDALAARLPAPGHTNRAYGAAPGARGQQQTFFELQNIITRVYLTFRR